MKKKLFISLSIASLLTMTGWAERVFNESGGLVVMEAENTESPFGNWVKHAPDDTGYPTGVNGTGHLEYMGPWGSVGTPLEYKFRINTPGKYYLQIRAHKRLDPGDEGDQHNDCYVKMAGDFTSGTNAIPLSVLLENTKCFGAGYPNWGRARTLDNGNPHVLEWAVYEFKAGEVYTLTISGRSAQFNIDRILFTPEGKPGLDELADLPESEISGNPSANAGDDQQIYLPISEVVLPGSGSDAGSIASYSWTQVSGPNTATLSGAATSNLTASALISGGYVFKLTVTDDEGLTGSDDVAVEVLQPYDMVLNPEVDAYVIEAQPDTNKGTAPKLQLAKGVREIYTRFDLTSLAGNNVQKAVLRLKVVVRLNTSEAQGSLQPVVDDTWGETNVTWNTKPVAGATFVSGDIPQLDQWLELDVTEYVKAELSGDQSCSLKLISDSGSLISFHAREATAEEDRPQLAIIYDSAVVGFGKYVQEMGLTGGTSGDDDGDGQNNIVEYALGGDATNRMVKGRISLDFTSDGNGHLFVPQLKNRATAGISYGISSCTNIIDGQWNSIVVSGLFTNDINGVADMEEVEYRFSGGSGSPEQLFIQVTVEQE